MKKIIYGAVGLFSLSSLTAVMAEEQPKIKLETVDVIGVTPLPGSGVDADKIPANIQTVTSEQLEKAQSLSLNEYISRYLGSVHINEAQNNPLQPDVYYRGFVASPLLGLPQGLSTYLNGVRFNEPFGDTVNWDLIPKGAIDTMTLVPGSNPIYGLNTLGGAIAVKTKTGFTAPGHQLEIYGGSWKFWKESRFLNIYARSLLRAAFRSPRPGLSLKGWPWRWVMRIKRTSSIRISSPAISSSPTAARSRCWISASPAQR